MDAAKVSILSMSDMTANSTTFIYFSRGNDELDPLI